MKKFYFLLLITLSAVLSACNFTQEGNSKATLSNTADTILTSEQPENLSDLQSNYRKRQEQFKAEQSENLSELQNCTVDHVSFSVDKTLTFLLLHN